MLHSYGKRQAIVNREAQEPDWTPDELAVLDRLTSPAAVQEFLDGIPYSADPIYRSPRSALRDRKAHCFDGALFAAAAFRRLGLPPLLVDLRSVRDDDHILTVFRRHGHWALAGAG